MSNLQKNQSRFLRLLADLIIYSYEQGYELTGGDLWARDGHKNGSFHYKRLAIDLNLFRDGRYLIYTADYEPLGQYWQSLDPGCTWGGEFTNCPDGNHFSYGEK